MNRSRCDVTPELLLSSCVIQCPVDKELTSTQPQSQVCSAKEIEDIADLLQNHKKRLIPESDIGLAVVHSSTEQYCNPDHECDKTQSTFLSDEHYKLQSQTLSQNFVYASETLFSGHSATENHQKTGTRQTGSIKEIPSSLRSNDDVIDDRSFSTKASSSKAAERPILNLAQKELGKHITTKVTSSDVSTCNTLPSDVIDDCSSLTKASTSKAVGRPVLNLARKESEKQTTSKVSSSNMDTTDDNTGSTMASELSSVRTKRSAAPESKDNPRNAKREKLDSQELFICPDDVKVEPSSPPSHEIAHDRNQRDYESIFVADTQPASLTLFKEESQDDEPKQTEPKKIFSQVGLEMTETQPIKRQRNSSDEESNKKLRLTHVSTTGTSKFKTNGDLPLPFGYLNSSLFNKSTAVTRDQSDANEEILCKSLRIIKIEDLVVKRTKPAYKENVLNDSSMKNFKKFKKSCHIGANRMPTIIGGRDLIVHTCKENLSEINEFLQNQETENTQPSFGGTGNTSFRANFTKKTLIK